MRMTAPPELLPCHNTLDIGVAAAGLLDKFAEQALEAARDRLRDANDNGDPRAAVYWNQVRAEIDRMLDADKDMDFLSA